jgi:hypothetical protein
MGAPPVRNRRMGAPPELGDKSAGREKEKDMRRELGRTSSSIRSKKRTAVTTLASSYTSAKSDSDSKISKLKGL